MQLATSFIEQQRAFLTQYTAVFLIILTFVVGAFSNPAAKKDPLPQQKIEMAGTGNLPKVEGPLPPPAAAPIGTLLINDAYTVNNNLNVDQLGGVVTALRSHDIGVRFLISVARSGNESDNGTLVARMVSSYRWLEGLNLPRHAYLVEGELSDGIAPALQVEFVSGVTE